MKPKLLQSLGILSACGGALAVALAFFKPSPHPADDGPKVLKSSRRAGLGSGAARVGDLPGRPDRGKSAREDVGSGTPEEIRAATAQDWDCPEKGPALRKALADWALKDVEACIKWLQGLPQPLGDNLSRDVAGSLMGDSAFTAFLILNELPPNPKNDEMIRQAAMEFATADLEAARRWADSQPDAAAAELLWSAVAMVMAQDHPEQAIAAVAEHLGHPEVRDRVSVEIVQRWMQKDVRAAADFALTLGGEAGLSAAHAVSGYWSRLSPENCESWIGSIPTPELKASAFSAYVDHQVLNDRPGVQRLLAETADPGLRAILEKALGR